MGRIEGLTAQQNADGAWWSRHLPEIPKLGGARIREVTDHSKG